MTIFLETKRLALKSPLNENLSLIRELWKNEKVRQFLGGILSDDEIDQKISSLQKHWNHHGFGQWLVAEKEHRHIIGLCGLHHSEDGIELSYMFFPKWWGDGFATEAAMASVKHGFSFQRIEKVIAITQEANNKSSCVLENIGMRHIDTFMRFNNLQRLYEITRNQRVY